MALTRDQILQKRKPVIHTVQIDEWGGDVCIVLPTPRELEKFTAHQSKLIEAGNGSVGFLARVAIFVCANEDGSRMFDNSCEEALSTDPMGVTALRKIHEFVAPLLGWEKAAKEDRAKNLQTTTGGDSTTD